jgi:hypothetical protein
MRAAIWMGLLLTTVAGVASCGASSARVPNVATSVAKAQVAPSIVQIVDDGLRGEWKRAGIVPAPRADDATFLRRAYVDLVGTVPPVDVTARFLADEAPDKRARLVESLLASPEYADHWMNYWDDVLMGTEVRGNLVDRAAFRGFLRARFAESAPWNAIVTELVAATGQNGHGGAKSGKKPGLAMGASTEETTLDTHPINGAVNWALRFEQNPQDLGGTASRVFLGVQIQCAQCHDHKTEKWTQEDFRRFSSAFLHERLDPIDGAKTMGAVRRVELVDAASAAPRFTKMADVAPLARAHATALDGTDLEAGKGTRAALARWMTSKESPWFAKAFVNRVWGHFLGRGFVDPVDDMRPSNPAVAPAVLDALAADFAAHDFDIKRLFRTICATEAYNLAASASAKTDTENHLWARFHLVPLGPEELLNAVFRVTQLEAAAEKAGIDDLDALRTNVVRQYAFLFDVDEEADAPDYSGTIAQALTLLNGALIARGSRALPGSTVGDLAAAPGTDASKIDALTMRVLARHPTTSEQSAWADYVAAADSRPSRIGGKRRAVSPKAAAYEDILWAMLNSSEFTFNH